MEPYAVALPAHVTLQKFVMVWQALVLLMYFYPMPPYVVPQ
jgi:hypothetical protein